MICLLGGGLWRALACGKQSLGFALQDHAAVNREGRLRPLAWSADSPRLSVGQRAQALDRSKASISCLLSEFR